MTTTETEWVHLDELAGRIFVGEDEEIDLDGVDLEDMDYWSDAQHKYVPLTIVDHKVEVYAKPKPVPTEREALDRLVQIVGAMRSGDPFLIEAYEAGRAALAGKW